MRYTPFFISLMLFCASCSQQVSEQKESNADTLDTDSAKVADAADIDVVDSACGCVSEDNSEEEFYDIQTCRFKIGFPIKGFEDYREIDSIVCFYNKLAYSPDAEYEVVTNDDHNPGGSYIKTEVYRRGKKVMEKYVVEGSEGGSETLTYYYIDQTVNNGSAAYYSHSEIRGPFGSGESDYRFYEQRYGQNERLFREIRCVTDKEVDGNPVLQVVRVVRDGLLPDTLTIGYQLHYYDYHRGYYNGEEYDVKSYLVVGEGKGEPVSDTVKLAAKRISFEAPDFDLDGLEFVEIGK